MNTFTRRVEELIDGNPALTASVQPLRNARETIAQRIADLDRKVLQLARSDARVRRFMTAPGIGATTGLCYLATIDDPIRFKKSRIVGAYVGQLSCDSDLGLTDAYSFSKGGRPKL